MSEIIDSAGVTQLTGVIECVTYSNEENGYAICDLGTDTNEIVTIVGTMPYIHNGDNVTVYGKWVFHPKYGRQFSVENMERQLPTGVQAIYKYLSSKTVKGIGKVTAKRIVDAFGENSFDILENHPDYLADVPGISPKKAKEISEEFKKQSGMRNAMMFFRNFFGSVITVRIYKAWGSSCVEKAQANPYALCEDIEGIGFQKADELARGMQFSQDSPERIISGTMYTLNTNAQQNGHVCLPQDKLIGATSLLLGVSQDEIKKYIDFMLQSGKIQKAIVDGSEVIYNPSTLRDEKYIAKRLLLLNKAASVISAPNIQAFIDREELQSGIQYAKLQKQAIYSALDNGVMILTGGPGTGKTTVVRALIHIFQDMGCEVALCAPTGRAAKRLSESTSCEAKTIHRLLEYGGDEDKLCFHRDEYNLLEEHVIIVDEASMIDNMLMCALLKAIKPGSRLILIGDSDQLPSVGAGNVLHDLIQSNRFSVVCLTEIFRQAQSSFIIMNAHAINHGEMPNLTVKDSDFFYMGRMKDSEIVQTIIDLYVKRLPNAYGEIAKSGTQVICPSRKGEVGTENINHQIQAIMNPAMPGKVEYAFRDIVFREGDRVMQIKNNYDLTWMRDDGETGNGIFNGDIGVIISIDKGDDTMRILFDDKTVDYDLGQLEDLELAYAVTVHKSQGSEYPIVIIPVGSIPPMLSSRNLLYTAVTRAQMMVILVGKQETIQTMVRNNRQSMRYTGLTEWLKKEQ